MEANKKPHRTRVLRVSDDCTHALANISRWHGRVTRPYSVLDHMSVGAQAFLALGDTERAVAFALHDYEEAILLGDIPPEQKKLYCNAAYRAQVAAVKWRLGYTYGVNLASRSVKQMDQLLLVAEHAQIAYNVPEDSVIAAAKEVVANSAVLVSIYNTLVAPRLSATVHTSGMASYEDTLLPLLNKLAKRPRAQRKKGMAKQASLL